jgi:hypothetical protein
MKNATAATMAMTPTIGKTVASATLPPWLKPELLEAGAFASPDDCVWVVDTTGVVEAAATHMFSYGCSHLYHMWQARIMTKSISLGRRKQYDGGCSVYIYFQE